MSKLAKIEQTTEMQAATPATLLQMAISQNADLDRLEKLMELQQRWEENEARKAYTVAMADFQADGITILKNKDAHNSKYATLAHTLETIGAAMRDHGFSHSWKTEQHDQFINVTCCVTHNMGHSECTSMYASADTSGSKNSIQAIGSTVSYLQRYTLYSILGLASKDQDNDGNSIGVINSKQVAQLEDLAKSVSADVPKFLEYMKVASLGDIDRKSVV